MAGKQYLRRCTNAQGFRWENNNKPTCSLSLLGMRFILKWN